MGVTKHFVDIGPLRRFPQYRRLWVGYAIRLLGAQLTATAVTYQVFVISHHSNLDVGYISLAQLIPAILAPMAGGAIADSMDRRRLLVLTAIGMAVCTVGLALNSVGGHPKLWPLFLLAAAIQAFNGVDGPTRTAVQMTLVDRDSFVAANVLRQMLGQISQVAGPALAGVLIALFAAQNFAWVYWLDVVSTLAALQAVARLDPLPPQGGGRRFSLASIGEGFAFLKGRQVIQACFFADLSATVLGLPVSLFPYMALTHYHGDARTFGILSACPGIGAFLGSVLSGWTSRITYQGRAVLISVAVWGIALTLFGVVPYFVVGCICVAIAGWADCISAIFRNTIIQVEAPDKLRGRLSSISTAVVQGGPRLGNMEGAMVASISTPAIAIVSGGLGCVAVIAAIARFMPKFSKYSLEESMKEDKNL